MHCSTNPGNAEGTNVVVRAAARRAVGQLMVVAGQSF